MIYKIHTLPVLRNEIKMYSNFRIERNKLIHEYVKPLRKLKLDLSEIESELAKIKSPGKGDGLGGYIQESDARYNDLISIKDRIEIKMKSYAKNNRNQFLKETDEWNKRMGTVEYYLSKMEESDKEFIEDLYIKHELSFRDVMEMYDISNNGDLYRKAKNILKKVL